MVARTLAAVADEKQRQRNPLIPHRPEAEHKQKRVAQSDLRERIFECPIGEQSVAAGGPEKHPEQNEDERPPHCVQSHLSA
jgi:hypothetical protein